MSKAEIELVLNAGALTGERPGWHPVEQRLYWVDIRAPALHAYDPATRRDESWEMPAWIGCHAPTEDGAIVALRTGLHAFDSATKALRFLAPTPFDPRRFLFNDGRCDRMGRFLVGPMFLPLAPGDEKEPKASPLWRYNSGAARGEEWTALTPPVSTSNGLAFSPDGATMYHADTKPKTIWAYDYDGDSGVAENRRVFARIAVDDTMGGPDGASVDADGFYWCAIFANGRLLRFDPDGKLEREIPLPVKYPTMVAFGGSDLRTLFITSANYPFSAEQRAARPLEGGLFAMAAPSPGLPPVLFNPDR